MPSARGEDSSRASPGGCVSHPPYAPSHEPHPATMSFNRNLAAQNARALTREELDLVIHVVCSALNARHFHGIQTVNDVRDTVDILAREQHRRDDHDAIAQTGT